MIFYLTFFEKSYSLITFRAHPLQRYPHGPNSGSGFGGPHCLHDEPAGIDTMNGGSGSDHIRDGQRHHFLDNDDRLRDPSAQTGYLGGPRFSGGLPHRMPFGR
ncbi:unnamed protein product [Protopolystoma xenopodis]|uniref:Uncharacterized protein n=1 Tax=Protopolystoma xenopodis TaxID=117903 RepID=A0A448WK36_9PLAT|nr:unnamed protein product [Protopolystoma xenopodis]